ncbi:MAG TPA: HAMP domain-containing protein, partial [Anaerolinea sp.]|nr:HAMP domain-containing protein [Anaerolinea sp.]
PPGSELLMLDGQGKILSHFPNNDQWRGKSLPESSVLTTLFKQKQGVLVGPGLDGREGVFAISPLSDTMDRIFVILGRPTSVAFAQANTTMTRNLAILLAVMAGMIALMWVIGDVLVVKNAQTLVQATRRLAQGDLTARSGVKYSQGEFGQLAQAFDGMAGELAARETERDRNVATLSEYARNLEHTNQELRDFTSIASHDLQEPLRKIQTFGELLQQRSGPNLDERGNDYIQRM